MHDVSSLTRHGTSLILGVLTTGPPGKSPYIVYFSSSVRTHMVSLLLYSIVWGSQKDPCKFRRGHRCYHSMGDMSRKLVRRTWGMWSTVLSSAMIAESSLVFQSWPLIGGERKRRLRDIKDTPYPEEVESGLRARKKSSATACFIISHLLWKTWKTTVWISLWTSLPSSYTNSRSHNPHEFHLPHPNFWSLKWLPPPT